MGTPLLDHAATLRDMGRRQNSVYNNLRQHMDGLDALVKRLDWQIATRAAIQGHIDSYINTNRPVPAELLAKMQDFAKVEKMDVDIRDRLKELGVGLLIQYKQTISLVNDTLAAAKAAAMYAEPEAKEIAKRESLFPAAGKPALTSDSSKAAPHEAQAVQEQNDMIESLVIDPPRFD